MNDARITLSGNVAVPPVLRQVASGDRVARFRIAHTPRRLDRATGEWTDGQTLWFGVSCWRATADNVAQSLRVGDRVVVSGRLTARAWTTPEGEERSGMDIDAKSVGLDLGRAPALTQRPVPVSVTTDPGDGLHADEDEPLDDALTALEDELDDALA